MKKEYFEPTLDIVKFSFSDSILALNESGLFVPDPTEDDVGGDITDMD